MKTPLRYAGGKSKAYKIITEYLPEHLPTGKIVSPFIGGGSLESRWSSELDIPVQGYDVLHPLVIFWNILLDHREDLVARCRYLEPTKDEYKQVKDELLKWCITQMMFPAPMDRDEKDRWAYYRVPDEEMITLCHKDAAAYFFYNHNLSYGPMYLGWMSKIYESREKWDRMIDRLEKYVNPNLNVQIGNMIDTIPYHKKDFLYLDPPYYLEKDADIIALKLLEKSGMSKKSFILAIEKLSKYYCIKTKIEKSICMDEIKSGWFSTHPTSTERLKYLKENIN